MAETRKIAAILVADVVGYSRLAGADEEGTLAQVREQRMIDPAVAAHRGRMVKRTGDGSLIEFRSVVDAVRCAIQSPPAPLAGCDAARARDPLRSVCRLTIKELAELGSFGAARKELQALSLTP